MKFSLRSLLVGITLIAMLLAIFLLRRENSELKTKLAGLHNEFGILGDIDRAKINVVRRDTRKFGEWEWRVFLPDSHKYVMHVHVGGIDSIEPLAPGEFTVFFQVSKQPDGSRKITSGHSGTQSSGKTLFSIGQSRAELVFDWPSQSQRGTARTLVKLDPNQKCILHEQINTPIVEADGTLKPSPTQSEPQISIWIEPMPE